MLLIGGGQCIGNQVVMFLMAQGAYSKLFFENGESKLLSHNLAYYQKLLPDYFYRVHRSFIVNKNHIISFHLKKRELKMKNGKTLIVSVRKLRELQKIDNLFRQK